MAFSIRYLICNSRMAGKHHVTNRILTSWDDVHACNTYVCKDRAEYVKFCQDIICKVGKKFWGDIELFDPETKERKRVDGSETVMTANMRTEMSASFGTVIQNAMDIGRLSVPTAILISTGEDSESGSAVESLLESDPTLSEPPPSETLVSDEPDTTADEPGETPPDVVIEDAPEPQKRRGRPPGKKHGKN